VLGLCANCILEDMGEGRSRAVLAHRRAREEFQLPSAPPRGEEGIRCPNCVNSCKIGPGAAGYCSVRRNEGGRLVGGDEAPAAVSWYRDPLPTNCVADWVCPASTAAGYPEFTDTRQAEYGHHNLAVFYEACSFDCLFCQNWHFKQHSVPGYIDVDQVGKIARFIARLSPDIPYALLAFHPSFKMTDLAATTRRQALECLEAACAAGLRRVRVGNLHLLH